MNMITNTECYAGKAIEIKGMMNVMEVEKYE